MSWALDNLTADQRERVFRDLLRQAGREVVSTSSGGRNLVCRCPIPGHEDHNPSFGYHLDKDVWACGTCGGSDLVNLFARVQGLTDAAALLELRRLHGLDGPQHGPAGDRPPGGESQRPSPPPKPELVIDEALWARATPLPEEWIARLMVKRGWSREVIQDLDLRLWRNDSDQELPWAPEGRVAIPIRDADGRLRNVRLYLPGAAQRKIFSWYQGPRGDDRVGYGSMRLFPPPNRWRAGETLWLVEGEADCLCALSHGLNAVTKTGGGKSSLVGYRHLFEGRDVVICYDADLAGADGGQKNARELAPVAKLVRLVRWPAALLPPAPVEPDSPQDAKLRARLIEAAASEAERDYLRGLPAKHGQDLTDWFVTHGRDLLALKELLAAARAVEAPAELPGADEDLPFPWRFFVEKNGRWSFKSPLLVQEIRHEMDLLTDPASKTLYRWNGQYWQRTDDDEITRVALLKLGIEANSARAEDACKQVKRLSLPPWGTALNPHPDLLCLRNGEFNLATGEIHRHRRESFLTYQLPLEFDPRTPPACPRWDRALGEILADPGSRPDLQEFFGLCLSRDTSYHKALFLQGKGADGKGTILNVLMALVGHENSSNVDLVSLEDQFHRASLFNKLLNVDFDIEGPAVYSGYFKKITSGDRINASYKHQQPFEFEPFCKLAFSCQSFPKVLDNSYAYYRRVLPIKCEFHGERRDPGLLAELLAELPGIFGWAWVGLIRLRQRGEFAATAATAATLQEYRQANNPVMGFVEEECDTAPMVDGAAPEMPKTRVYDAYAKFCKARGFLPLNMVHLCRELYRLVPDLREGERRVEGKRVKHFVGLRLAGEV